MAVADDMDGDGDELLIGGSGTTQWTGSGEVFRLLAASSGLPRGRSGRSATRLEHVLSPRRPSPSGGAHPGYAG